MSGIFWEIVRKLLITLKKKHGCLVNSFQASFCMEVCVYSDRIIADDAGNLPIQIYVIHYAA